MRVKKLNGESARVASAKPFHPVASSTLQFANRQRTQPLHLRLLHQITTVVLAELPGVISWQLTFYMVGAKKMAAVNQTQLGHSGPTDVITFNYNDPALPAHISGEIFICVDVAIRQAREFRTTWQSEIVRYIVHALLHLRDYDDRLPAPRRRMKRVENRLVQKLARCFRFAVIGR